MTRVLCRRCLRPILTVRIRVGDEWRRLRLDAEPHPQGTHVRVDDLRWAHICDSGIGLARERPAHRIHQCRITTAPHPNERSIA